ncbi:hypothetical protein IPdc08_00714 [archaeon]|nr:hypothetical protein IPdc08_00714 [archaeon]
MPHKCTKCGKVYQENDEKILRGCECGNRMFFYFRKLTHEEAEKIERDSNAKKVKNESLSRVINDIEKDAIWNIKAGDGIYEINLDSLMSREPLIVEGDEGEYLVSLSSLFELKKGLKKYIDIIKK